MNAIAEKALRAAATDYVNGLVDAWLKSDPPMTEIDAMVTLLRGYLTAAIRTHAGHPPS